MFESSRNGLRAREVIRTFTKLFADVRTCSWMFGRIRGCSYVVVGLRRVFPLQILHVCLLGEEELESDVQICEVALQASHSGLGLGNG
jgi:hypothetical protein